MKGTRADKESERMDSMVQGVTSMTFGACNLSNLENNIEPSTPPPKPRRFDTTSVPKSCCVCHGSEDATVKLCSSCKAACYCSLECQRKDWFYHGEICKQYRRLKRRPSQNHVLAIHFRENYNRPKLVWIAVNNQSNPKVMHLLGDDVKTTARIRIKTDARTAAKLSNCVELWLRDDFRDDSCMPNRGLQYATASTKVGHTWRGPCVLMQWKGVDQDVIEFQDVNLADYRYMRNWATFALDEMIGITESVTDVDLGEAQLAVVVTCYGDQEVSRESPFFQVFIPKDHPIFQSGKQSPLSQHLKEPLLAMKLPSNDRWLAREVWTTCKEPPGCNPDPPFLFRNIDIGKDDFGWAPSFWLHGNGNVLLARPDGRDLLVHQAYMLCSYCRWEVDDPIRAYLRDIKNTSKRKVLASLKSNLLSEIKLMPVYYQFYLRQFTAQSIETAQSWSM